MMEDRMKKMEDGKLALDLLIGLSIFLFTFIFIANFLPGVFAEARNEISLMHEAYRLGVILAEMEGFWRDSSGNGTNWHEKSSSWSNPNFYFFPGLTKGKADFLSYDKIRAFDRLVDRNITLVKELLGLRTIEREFHFNVSLESIDSTSYSPVLVRNKTGDIVLQTGERIPSIGYVARYERFVWIDPYYDLLGTFYIGSGGSKDRPQVCKSDKSNEERRERELQCSLTYPIKLFVVNVYGKEGSADPWWLGICLNNDSIPSCNADRDTIAIDFGSGMSNNPYWKDNLEAGKRYHLTKVINDLLKSKGFKVGDTVNIGLGIKNTNATLDLSDSVVLIAGKAAAKLVINVW
ncbi:MAG: hypothetical protein NZ879_02795 [Archaeoglobaceae archaeon]|nr:hypothetical protein [Archaeoglobaceae archaeon]MDW8117893.1 hypothetical protein [Archaeoglobaceae archaeon]